MSAPLSRLLWWSRGSDPRAQREVPPDAVQRPLKGAFNTRVAGKQDLLPALQAAWERVLAGEEAEVDPELAKAFPHL